MQTIITEKQARQITGGRKPLVPIEYETALKALAECSSIDEARYWESKADALAAWAKIYHDDEVRRQAASLKAHAYRRMGLLAEELRPTSVRSSSVGAGSGKLGRMPGAASMLMAHGLAQGKASRALAIARAPQEQFDKAVKSGHGIHRIANQFRGLGTRKGVASEAHRWLTVEGVGPKLLQVRAQLRQKSAKAIGSGVLESEAKALRLLVVEIQEWLDELEQYMPGRAKKCEHRGPTTLTTGETVLRCGECGAVAPVSER